MPRTFRSTAARASTRRRSVTSELLLIASLLGHVDGAADRFAGFLSGFALFVLEKVHDVEEQKFALAALVLARGQLAAVRIAADRGLRDVEILDRHLQRHIERRDA